jgi:hypothetical protein
MQLERLGIICGVRKLGNPCYTRKRDISSVVVSNWQIAWVPTQEIVGITSFITLCTCN